MKDIIDIGFAEECEPWRLESRFFPSKIGGKPAWLDLQNIPNTEQLQCNYCKNPCIFLCQIYAPYEEDPKAFHRTIYVFICKNPDCCKENSNGNIKVLRSQLQRSNKFYPPDPPIEEKNWRTDIICDKWSKNCTICGIYSSSHCGKCKKVNYCCRMHQILDWKNGHKDVCGSENSTIYSQFLFPEYELVIERERYEPENKTDTSEQEMKTFQNLIESGQAGSLQTEKNVDSDLLQMASEIEDKTFLKFQKRVKSEPDQVIRYNRGGSPLYISSSHQPAEIPNCEICGEIRQFEFQVMPQLINYLKLEDVLNSIDWGILAIYTCKNSCIPQSKYVKEFAWKQDITKEIITQ
ncbi:programmed cell death protein 2 isoform X1 [Phymastichus coffea]|uniref:programmed cell death protein 2 isoform X1 n=1 Tax=Phymastichus coffea TaxID=108790 RepID=UPI00273A7874|nr:programmed cell death protein 2 isoform X1 [Phymastichus coffea]XP_058804605.1 programmed cell death protein 2 isoform X1 [Phymastichus coffea]